MDRTVRTDATGFYVKVDKCVYRPATQTGVYDGQIVRIWRNSDRSIHLYNLRERWVTTSKPPPRKRYANRQVKGQKKLAKLIGGGNVSVIVSEGNTLKINGRTRKGEIYFAANNGLTMTLQQWRDFVVEVSEFVESAQVEKVAAALQEEVALEDQIDEIRKHYTGDSEDMP